MFDDVLVALDAEVDGLLRADMTGGSGPELMGLVVAWERLQRRMVAVRHRVLAQVEVQRLAGDYARATTVELLITALRVSPAEARARVAQAEELGPRSTLQGAPLRPRMPHTAAAVTEGVLSTGHVSEISRCLRKVPSWVSADAVDTIEKTLVGAAMHEHPVSLRRTAELLLARLDQDGPEPSDEQIQRQRALTLTPGRGGMTRITGDLTPECTAVWETVLDSLAAPAPAAEGMADDRTPGQRRHDAFLEAGYRLLRSATLPAAGGVPVTVLVRTTATDLNAGRGVVTTSRGDVLGLTTLTPALGEAEIATLVIGEHGDVLAMGRASRLATRNQRLALTARDGGCCFPGCDKPAAWSEIHHVREWANRGPTDLDNLCMLCRFHHREFEKRGWQVRMNHGVPEWIPPAFTDPLQRPLRNTGHHPPDIRFPELDLAKIAAHRAA